MKSPSGSTEQAQLWGHQLRRGLVTLRQLEERGWLDAPADRPEFRTAQSALDIRVPAAFHEGIQNGDKTLAAQVIPSLEEAAVAAEELADPIGDEIYSPVAGLTHRYTDRALIKITYQCAVYCRFCFRRHKVSHSEENLSFEALRGAYDYVEKNPQIKELIFTGGDPLVITDARLEQHLARADEIDHLESIRIHTRIPLVLPERITPALCERLAQMRKLPWIVIHCNSASELTPAALEAIARLRKAGIPLAAQSVLLKGVNDSQEALERLFRGLYRNGVKPYYLHYPDLARGTNHFRIPLERAIGLISDLRGRLPGLALPQLTVDIPAGHGKIAVEPATCRKDPNSLENQNSDNWQMKSPLTGEWTKVSYPRGSQENP